MPNQRSDDIPRELERSGELCLAFANTAAARLDGRYRGTGPPARPAFDGYADLLEWCRRMGAVTTDDAEHLDRLAGARPADAAAVYRQGLELRAAVGRIFTAVAMKKEPSDDDLGTLNAVLAGLPPRRVARQDDGFAWAFATAGDALERALWPVGRSAAELLVSADRRWVRRCDDPQCTRLFVDRHSRRRKWCDANICGSRARGKRFYRRGGRVRV